MPLVKLSVCQPSSSSDSVPLQICYKSTISQLFYIYIWMTDEYMKFLSLFLCLYIQSKIRFLWRTFAVLVLFSGINDMLNLLFSTKFICSKWNI